MDSHAVDAFGIDAETVVPTGLDIRFDYRFDTTGFFADPSRRAVLAAAAATWGRLIADDFDPIPAGTSIRTRDPQAPTEGGMSFTAEESIDDVLVFVGCADLDSGNAQSNHAAALGSVRDSGLRNRLTTRYHGADFEPWTGWITFGCTTAWFFDASPETDDDIPSGMADFYSTALHEIGHVLGFGTSDAFAALIDPKGNFVGSRAIAAHGGSVPLTANGIHLRSELVSDGRPTLMDPSRTVGTRTPPTSLDRACLADIGYEVR